MQQSIIQDQLHHLQLTEPHWSDLVVEPNTDDRGASPGVRETEESFCGAGGEGATLGVALPPHRFDLPTNSHRNRQDGAPADSAQMQLFANAPVFGGCCTPTPRRGSHKSARGRAQRRSRGAPPRGIRRAPPEALKGRHYVPTIRHRPFRAQICFCDHDPGRCPPGLRRRACRRHCRGLPRAQRPDWPDCNPCCQENDQHH